MQLLSHHAGVRANQRGVTGALLEALLTWADVEAPAQGGCTLVRFSRERLADRSLRAHLGAAADRVASLAAIIGETGEVVTVLHAHSGRAGRRYRRGH
jgi:hypothetical protein